jgi:enoyl-CoA hydratase/carnithine racemase
MGENVLYKKKGHIVYITMNRPEKLNALNRALVEGLKTAWAKYSQDDDAYVAVLAGAGGKAFCAGMDLNDQGDLSPAFPGIGIELYKPVIAAINGYCFGGGLAVAMYSDIRIASSDAQFAMPEAKRGIMTGYGQALTRYIPMGVAMELLITGNVITAQRAYEIGFVNQVVAPDKLTKTAVTMAEGIAENAPILIKTVKKLVQLQTYPSVMEVATVGHRIVTTLAESEDAKEGARALMEKRKPVFKGR